MQLTDIKKHDRREREDVTDQKYGIIFKAAVNLQKGIDKIELKVRLYRRREEGIGFYVAFNSLGHIETR